MSGRFYGDDKLLRMLFASGAVLW